MYLDHQGLDLPDVEEVSRDESVDLGDDGKELHGSHLDGSRGGGRDGGEGGSSREGSGRAGCRGAVAPREDAAREAKVGAEKAAVALDGGREDIGRGGDGVDTAGCGVGEFISC